MHNNAADLLHTYCDTTENHRITVSLSKCTKMYDFSMLIFCLRTAHPVSCTKKRAHSQPFTFKAAGLQVSTNRCTF